MSGERASFDPARYERLSTGTVPGYAALQELVALAAAAWAPVPCRALDLGCGTGAGLVALGRALPGAQLVGCDPVAPMVEAARSRCEQSGVPATLAVGGLDVARREGPFDVVVCTLVLQFVAPDERAGFLEAIHRSLRPGGSLVLTVLGRAIDPETQRAWAEARRHYALGHGVKAEELAARENETRGQVHPLAPDELHELVAAAGFRTVTPLYQVLAVHTWRATA